MAYGAAVEEALGMYERDFANKLGTVLSAKKDHENMTELCLHLFTQLTGTSGVTTEEQLNLAQGRPTYQSSDFTLSGNILTSSYAVGRINWIFDF